MLRKPPLLKEHGKQEVTAVLLIKDQRFDA
jgi:hypothetical protein